MLPSALPVEALDEVETSFGGGEEGDDQIDKLFPNSLKICKNALKWPKNEQKKLVKM